MCRPGDIVVVDFPGVAGVKRRPAVVLSSPTYHRVRPDVIVGLITSQTAAATCPTDHALEGWRACGLRRPSAFRAFLVTVPRAALGAVIGRLSDPDWQAVCACVKQALAVARQEE